MIIGGGELTARLSVICIVFLLTVPIALANIQRGELTGVVLDPTGAVITGAKIIIRGNQLSPVETETDQKGEFRLNHIAAGDYEIEALKDGFKPAITRLKVNSGTPTLKIVLQIADVHDELVVVDKQNRVNTNPDENLNVIKVDRETLNNLPVLGNDVVGSLSRLLDQSSTGTGAASVLVDGLETTDRVRASSIKEIRINQNPYSAEFARPGRGRIEVITRPGEPEFHGEFNFIFRDSFLDARNAFAVERAPEQRRIYEGSLTGPIGRSGKTSFLFSVEREEEDLQAVVFASTPTGIFSANVATPERDTEFSFRIDRLVSNETMFSIRYEYTWDSARNGEVGGFNLPQVAVNSSEREHQLFFSHRKIISSSLVNELTIRADTETSASSSARPGVQKLIVADSFVGGGAQVDERSTENQFQLNEILSLNRGKHFIKTGVNIPNITRRGLSDRTNFGGTFSFSTLDDFESNRPFLFSANEGNGHLVFWQKEIGFFVQDTILVRPNLSIAPGLRYEKQNYLGDNNNFSPRFSFAYAPDANRKTVIRGGAGFFYDRTGGGPIRDRLRFDGQRLRQVNITEPGYPDPFSSGGALSAQPTSIVRFAPNLRSPYTFQVSMGVERQLANSLTATVNYVDIRGVKLFRSRDINAPSTSDLQRPDPGIGVLRLIESSALSRTHLLELTLRGSITRFFSGTIQYNLGRAYNNTGGVNSRPADNYDLSGEWARSDFDERHRLNVLGTFNAGEWLNLGMTLLLTSGGPYSLTTGRDDNRDNVANDRPPGVPRNSLQGPGAATLDLRWNKEFNLRESKGKDDDGPVISVSIAAFNVFNRTNYTGFVGNLSSSFFGLPVASQPARRTQVTLGFSF